MPNTKETAKMKLTIPAGAELVLGGMSPLGIVGEKKNYNLQPGVTEYTLWAASTIEWVAAQDKFHARVLVQNKTTKDIVVFNSWHQDFSDAERAIDLVSDSLNGVGERRVYNVFGETIEVHTSDMGGGSPTSVTEVRALIWSMLQSAS